MRVKVGQGRRREANEFLAAHVFNPESSTVEIDLVIDTAKRCLETGSGVEQAQVRVCATHKRTLWL